METIEKKTEQAITVPLAKELYAEVAKIAKTQEEAEFLMAFGVSVIIMEILKALCGETKEGK